MLSLSQIRSDRDEMMRKLSKIAYELSDREKENSELSQGLLETREVLKEANHKLHDASMKFVAAQNLIKLKDEEIAKLKIQLTRVYDDNGSFKKLDELIAENENKDIFIALLTDNMSNLEDLLEESHQEVVKVQQERSMILDQTQKLQKRLESTGVDLQTEAKIMQKLNEAQKKLQDSINENKQLTGIVNDLQSYV